MFLNEFVRKRCVTTLSMVKMEHARFQTMIYWCLRKSTKSSSRSVLKTLQSQCLSLQLNKQRIICRLLLMAETSRSMNLLMDPLKMSSMRFKTAGILRKI
uniref:(northern house mosquito) hypothetical protein n=1 Tax=Culex pipiens TaxID=7175 RepID=A0A8D8B1E5_CULPI